ncbi:universal stress protein [Thermodesulfobacteriota bacterium]
MEKKILIAVDESINSRKSIEYVAKMDPLFGDISYTLINIQPMISDFIIDDAKRDVTALALVKKVEKKNRDASEKILAESISRMSKLGVDENRITTISQPKAFGAAKDILNYAEKPPFDAVVVGNRGVSAIAESFRGSVTNSVLEHSGIVPVWAVGGEPATEKIIIAVDGSESALNAVDHVSFIFTKNTDIEFTLLHVTPRLKDYCTIEFTKDGDIVEDVIAKGDKKCVDSFYELAIEKFNQAGIKEDQIDYKEVASTLNVGKTIVKEAEKGKFGNVVIGRRGINKSFFLGSVSRHILSKASNCAVWLVP